MSHELMHGHIGFTPKDCDLAGTHRKAVMYDDVRRILNERGVVDIFLGEDEAAVLSLWKVKGTAFNAPHTHIAILSSEPFDGISWYIVEEQQFYLCDEEKAVIAFVGRLHQDNWKEFDETGSLFKETTIDGKTEEQHIAAKKAAGTWPFNKVEA